MPADDAQNGAYYPEISGMSDDSVRARGDESVVRSNTHLERE